MFHKKCIFFRFTAKKSNCTFLFSTWKNYDFSIAPEVKLYRDWLVESIIIDSAALSWLPHCSCIQLLRCWPLVVSLFSKGPSSGFTLRAEQAHGERRTQRHPQKAVWMRGTWEETTKRQTTRLFWKNQKKWQRMQYISSPQDLANPLFSSCLLSFKMHEDEFTFSSSCGHWIAAFYPRN